MPTFTEHFTKLMKDRGQSDKEITLALMSMPVENRQLSELEMKAMNELADICAHMPTAADRHIENMLKLNRRGN